MTSAPLTRLYRKGDAPSKDGRQWFYGECPNIPGCIVYSEIEKEVPELLEAAIDAMMEPEHSPAHPEGIQNLRVGFLTVGGTSVQCAAWHEPKRNHTAEWEQVG